MPKKMKALELSPEELDEAATITFEDVEEAKQKWRRDAPPRYKGLLDAEVNVER